MCEPTEALLVQVAQLLYEVVLVVVTLEERAALDTVLKTLLQVG